MINIIKFILFILLLGQAFSKEKKLLFVQLLVRHGDRSPTKLYPNDLNPASLWPEGLKELTTLGRKQQYALGKYFRSKYENFTTFCPWEVNVLSSETDRCLISSESNMASFFAPPSEWSIDPKFVWQPIPIHYIPTKQDKVLSTVSYCPRADEETKRLSESPKSQKILKKHEVTLKKLSFLSGFAVDNWSTIFNLHDTLSIEKKHNMTLPTGIEPYLDELSYLAGGSFNWQFNSPLSLRLRAGPLIQKVIETINQKINGETPNLKFQVYTMHETSLAVFLVALNSYNMIQPPVCATLMIELFEMPDGMKTVRFLYLNSSTPEANVEPPHTIILEGCTEFCPLDYFINYTSSFIPEDWDLECELDKSLFGKIGISKLAALLCSVMAGLNIFCFWYLYSRKQKKYGYRPIR